jgi:hypothetical protein
MILFSCFLPPSFVSFLLSFFCKVEVQAAINRNKCTVILNPNYDDESIAFKNTYNCNLYNSLARDTVATDCSNMHVYLLKTIKNPSYSL